MGFTALRGAKQFWTRCAMRLRPAALSFIYTKWIGPSSEFALLRQERRLPDMNHLFRL